MSTPQQTPQYGVKSYDLSTARANENDYELINIPQARVISTLDVPDECYLRLGTKRAPRLDLREFETIKRRDPFGQVYLENPSGATGTLRFVFGVDVDAALEPTIDTIESITGTVSTTDVQPTSLTAFTYTTSSTSAEQLGSNAVAANGSVLVQADDGNTDHLFVGNATNQPYRLDPGESVSFDLDNTDVIHVNAVTSGDAVNVMAEA